MQTNQNTPRITPIQNMLSRGVNCNIAVYW